MSSEYPENLTSQNQSLANARKFAIGQLFKAQENKYKNKAKKSKYWTLSRDLVKEVCPAMGLTQTDINKFWFNNYEVPDILKSFKESCQDSHVDRIFVFPKKVPQKKFAEWLIKENFYSSALYQYFCNCKKLEQEPLLLFKVPAKHNFLMKFYSSEISGLPCPRILVPSKESYGFSIEIMKIKTYTESIHV